MLNHPITRNRIGIIKTVLAPVVALTLLCGTLTAQPRQKPAAESVSGVVVDEVGHPIVGAAIVIEGTTQGVSADTAGAFTIGGVTANSILLVSSLGYIGQKVAVGNSTYLTVSLVEEPKMLDDVVVVGYGSQRKINLTGAVEQVGSDVFEGRPAANVTQMLQGAIPNLNLVLADGKPNRTAVYNIRGVTSIGAGGSALILIDGVDGDPAMLNPNDIESISVLKDAASSAIYGSRAPYGVVLITTKNPSKIQGTFKVNYSGNISFEQPTATPDIVTDGYLYASMFEQAWYNFRFTDPVKINAQQIFSKEWLEEFGQRRAAGNTAETDIGADGKYVYYGNADYYDALYKDVVTARTHNISINSSHANMSQSFSARIYDYDGLYNFTPDTYRTMNIRHKSAAQVTDWLQLSNNFDYACDDYLYPIGAALTTNGNVWRNISDAGFPCSPIFNPDGTMTLTGATAMGGLISGNSRLKSATKTLKNTTAVKMSFLDGKLRLNGDFSFRNKDYSLTKKLAAVPYSAAPNIISYLGTPSTGDTINETTQFYDYMAANAYAEYENTFAAKHYVKALLGYNYERQDYRATSLQRNGLLTTEVDNINLATGDVMSITGDAMRVHFSVSTTPTTTDTCSRSTVVTTVRRSFPTTRSGVSSPRRRPLGVFRKRSSGRSIRRWFRMSSCAPRSARWATATFCPTLTSKHSPSRHSVLAQTTKRAFWAERPNRATHPYRRSSPII